MSSQMSDMNLQRRKVVTRLILGGASALTLVACGGGGGGDSNSDKKEALKSAYSKLEKGMDWTDVEALVGFPANNERVDTWLVWVVEDVRLGVSFQSNGKKLIDGASLKVGSNPSLGQSFYY